MQPISRADAKPIPMEAIGLILKQVMDQAVSNGANSVSMPGEYVSVAHFLSYPNQYNMVLSESPSKPYLSDEEIIRISEKYGGWVNYPPMPDHFHTTVIFKLDTLRQILQSSERDEDSDRINWLEAAAENGHVSMCFEMDGGVHLTLDGVGETQEAYRNKNTIREAIDAAIAASSTTKGQ